MDITITINTDNDAFQPHPEWELRRILDKFSNGLKYQGTINPGDTIPLHDINGGRVGQFTVKES